MINRRLQLLIVFLFVMLISCFYIGSFIGWQDELTMDELLLSMMSSIMIILLFGLLFVFLYFFVSKKMIVVVYYGSWIGVLLAVVIGRHVSWLLHDTYMTQFIYVLIILLSVGGLVNYRLNTVQTIQKKHGIELAIFTSGVCGLMLLIDWAIETYVKRPL